MAAAVPYVVTAAATWAIGQLVSNNLSEDPDQPIRDDKPTTLSNRGEYLPLLIGRERMGAFFAWAGNRVIEQESTSSGGKGFSGGGVGQDVYYERGMHLICVGPATAIHRIWRNGEQIADFSTITPETHPDGTTIEVFFEEDGEDLKMGDMIVYWGFSDGLLAGTVNSKTGIDSAYPGVLRIVWQNMRLGGFPQWPLVEYDVEVRPYREGYNSTTPWEDADATFDNSVGDWLETLFGPSETELHNVVLFDNSQGTAGTIVHVEGNHALVYGEVRNNNERVTISSSEEEPLVNGTYRINSAVSWNPDKVVTGIGDEVDQGLPNASSWNIQTGTLDTVLNETTPGGTTSTVRDLDGIIFHDSGGDFTPIVKFTSTFKPLTGGGALTYKMILRDTDNSVDHAAIYSDGSVSVTNGGEVEIEALGYGWRRMTFTYRTGEGSLPSTTFDALQYKIESDRSCYLYDTGNFLEAWHSPQITITGTTSFEIDYYLPTISEAPFVDGDAIPWQSGYGPKGPNPASVLHQLLFAPAPYGAELDETWFKTDEDGTPSIPNYHTLRKLAEVANNFEGINAHVLIQRGDTFQSAVDNFLLDMGWMISWDPAIARYVFSPLRDPNNPNLVGNAPMWEVPVALLTNGPPQTVSLLEDIGPNRISYSYKDVNRNYKTDSVVLSADGQIENEGIQRQDDSNLFIARDRTSAERLAQRRGQIDLYKPSTFTLDIGANGKLLYPGNTFIFEDSPDIDREDIFRVIEVRPSQTEGSARIVAAYDIYSLEESGDAVTENLELSLGPSGDGDRTAGVEDLAVDLLELPAAVSNSGRAFTALRIRANSQIRDADIHVSRDDSSYSFLARQQGVVTGGELLETWDSSVDGDVTDGPLIKPLGPDFTRLVQTLDSFNFAAGRQVAIIGEEWFFLKSVTAEEHGTYRLTGFYGGKYGSSRTAHDVGDLVYICDPSSLPIYRDVLAAPSALVYMKTAPRAQTRVPVTDITAVSKTLTGVSGPNAAMIHSGDETDLETTYPAADYDGGSVMLQNSVSGNWQNYFSDGASWNLID